MFYAFKIAFRSPNSFICFVSFLVLFHGLGLRFLFPSQLFFPGLSTLTHSRGLNPMVLQEFRNFPLSVRAVDPVASFHAYVWQFICLNLYQNSISYQSRISGLRAGWSRVRSSGLRISLLTTKSRPALGPTQPPIQCVPGALNLGVNRPEREADYSPPSTS
jgi:hypothetical protein